MRIDRRGDIGFMEAMAGTMTVCIVLMGFTAFLVTEMEQPAEEGPEFDWRCIINIRMGVDSFIVQTSLSPKAMCEKFDLSGIEITTSTPTHHSFHYTFGHGDRTGDYEVVRKVYNVDTYDGIDIPAIVEVKLFT